MSTKEPKSDSIALALRNLKAERDVELTIYNTTMTALPFAQRKIDMFKTIYMSVQSAYGRTLRVVDELEETLKNSNYSIGVLDDTIRMKNIELEVVSYEEKKKLSKRKDTPDSILTNLNYMPEDVVRIIGEFLPYTIRIFLLESRRPINSILNKLSAQVLRESLVIICITPDFLRLLPYEEAMKEILMYDGEELNPSYNPLCKFGDTLKEVKTKFKYIINLAKERNPKFAYNILKTIHILFDPVKKYTTNSMIRRRRIPFVIQDLV